MLTLGHHQINSTPAQLYQHQETPCTYAGQTTSKTSPDMSKYLVDPLTLGTIHEYQTMQRNGTRGWAHPIHILSDTTSGLLRCHPHGKCQER